MSRRAAPVSALTALALTALLAACGDSSEVKYAPACPQLSLLADGADLVRFAGAGRDVTDRVVEARIAGVDAKCAAGRRGDVVATIRVRADVARGPAGRGRNAQIPYFVAVMQGDAVLDRQAFVLTTNFQPNVDSMTVVGDELQLRFAGAGDRGAAQYRIIVSLQLTEEELAYNRRVHAR